jgi:chondroitin 4-sulfotransferase 11
VGSQLSQFKIESFQLLEKVFGKERVLHYYKKYCINTYLKRGIIFIHIPKNGGTSITDFLYGKRAGHNTALEIQKFLGEEKFSDIYSFSLSRNPYDRLLSAYNYAINGGGAQGGIRRRKEYSSLEFKSFSTFVKEWLIFQDSNELEIIFQPQFLFVCDGKEKPILNWIGKVENPGEVEKKLEEITGQPAKIKRLNKTLGIMAKGIYDDELYELVFHYYQRDFEIFDYNPFI